MPFGEFLLVTEFTADQDIKAQMDSGRKYKYGFAVQSRNRVYELYCKTEPERMAWLCAFKYLVLSTMKV